MLLTWSFALRLIVVQLLLCESCVAATASTAELGRHHNLTIREHKCCHRGEYSFRSWAPMPVGKNELFSVVQHCPPPCSLASHCDWVVGSRFEHWGALPHFTAWGDPDTVPRTIFVQTDELQTFSESLLRCIPRHHRVVLITGDHDKTTPLQLDRRWGQVLKPGTWVSWLADERISHIFVEHLDAPAGLGDKISPIPTGMSPDDSIGSDPIAAAPRRVQIQSLPLRAVDIGRQRGGAQFEERARVRQLCNSSRWPWCDVAEPSKEDFIGVLKKYPFVLCVHGGGIDPNPKLFSAIIAGAIPIMRDFPGAIMYDNWPVVRVSSWTDINPSRLAQWRELHARAFEDERLRNRTLHRLTMRHWWSKIMAHVQDPSPPPAPRWTQSSEASCQTAAGERARRSRARTRKLWAAVFALAVIILRLGLNCRRFLEPQLRTRDAKVMK